MRIKVDTQDKPWRELWEKFLALPFPEETDRRLQHLMDRNNDGLLNSSEKKELELFVEVSQLLSLARAKVLGFLQGNR